MRKLLTLRALPQCRFRQAPRRPQVVKTHFGHFCLGCKKCLFFRPGSSYNVATAYLFCFGQGFEWGQGIDNAQPQAAPRALMVSTRDTTPAGGFEMGRGRRIRPALWCVVNILLYQMNTVHGQAACSKVEREACYRHQFTLGSMKSSTVSQTRGDPDPILFAGPLTLGPVRSPCPPSQHRCSTHRKYTDT